MRWTPTSGRPAGWAQTKRFSSGRSPGGCRIARVVGRRPGGETWVVKQALPKLRVAVDWFSDPARIERAPTGMRRLVQLAPGGAHHPVDFRGSRRHLLAMEAVPEPHRTGGTCSWPGRSKLHGWESLPGCWRHDPWRGVPPGDQLARGFARAGVLRVVAVGAVLRLFRPSKCRRPQAFLESLIADTRQDRRHAGPRRL